MFKKEKKKIIKQIIKSYSKLKKLDFEQEQAIQDILDEIDTDGFAVVIGKVQAFLDEIGGDGADLAFIQIGALPVSQEALTATDATTMEFAKNRAAELVGMKYTAAGDLIENPNADWAITDSTRDMLRSTLVKAMEDGLSNDELASALEDNFAFSESRADMIARTETKRADMQGSLTAYKNSGIVKGKQSIISDDHDHDDECDDNEDAGIIPIDEDFPSGDDAPPYHPNCNCSMAPADIESASDNEDNSDNSDEEDSAE